MQRASSVWLATSGYAATVRTARGVYLAGDTFPVEVGTRAPDGSPVSRELRLEVLRQEQLFALELARRRHLQQPVRARLDLRRE